MPDRPEFTPVLAAPRRRVSSAGGALLLLVALLAGAPAALSQTPPPAAPDTIPGDTIRVRIPPEAMETDTLPRDTIRTRVPDTLAPPPHLPRFPQPGTAGWPQARWDWDRADLLRFHGLSLLELLVRTPGLVATRGGGAGMPAGVAAMGQGGGRLRVFRDGYELDPLGTATLDLQQIGLLDLEQVRVERTLIETRVHLRTFQLADQRPFSEVEVGTGNFQARFLRAMFTRPAFGRSVVTAAYDLSSAGGFRFTEPSSFTSGRLRVDRALGDASGLQLEYTQTAVTRESPLYPTDFARRELVLRARSQLAPRLLAEALVGRASHAPALEVDPLTGRPIAVDLSADTLDVPLSSTQASARATLQLGPGSLEAGARVRAGGSRGFGAPSNEFTLRAGLQPIPWLAAEGSLRSTGSDGGRATEAHATVRSGALLGLSVFGSLGAGERWVTLREDAQRIEVDTTLVDGVPIEIERTLLDPRFVDVRTRVDGIRAGVEWAARGSRLGVAAINTSAGTVVPFGMGFDRGMPALSVGSASGVEGFATLALGGPLQGLSLEGWYTHWTNRGGRPYLPAGQGRAAAVFTGLFREAQLEPYARLEATHRGSTLVPDATRTTLVEVSPYTLLDFSLQLRIIDVRAFFVFENMLGELDAVDVPGRFLPPARTLYGIRWFFRN